MSTDIEWEKWGAKDPYFGVLTNPKFRKNEMTSQARQEFFSSGRVHVDYVLAACRLYLDPAFAPSRVLDFGCGVGRLLIRFAETAVEVVGMDVAPSMLAEARKNMEEQGVENVSLALSDDALSTADGQFDLVHSCIVLQHIEVARGRALFSHLIDKVGAGGCGAIHVTFGWTVHKDTFGIPPAEPLAPPPPTDLVSRSKASASRMLTRLGLRQQAPTVAIEVEKVDPEMQMNYYNLSELMFIMHEAGVHSVHTDFTDHGGALGAFLFFRKPGST